MRTKEIWYLSDGVKLHFLKIIFLEIWKNSLGFSDTILVKFKFVKPVFIKPINCFYKNKLKSQLQYTSVERTTVCRVEPPCRDSYEPLNP